MHFTRMARLISRIGWVKEGRIGKIKKAPSYVSALPIVIHTTKNQNYLETGEGLCESIYHLSRLKIAIT